MFGGMGKNLCGLQVSFFINWKVASKKLHQICLFHITAPSFVKSQLPFVQVFYFIKIVKHLSICFQEQDNSLKAEWLFFARSHDKSPCDGVRGSVKCLVGNASLKARYDKCILTPVQLYERTTKNIKGLHFFYISSENANASCVKFGFHKWYSFGNVVDGTRSHHSFIPVSMNNT